MLSSFFTEERVHGGWRFWVLWVLLTNVGFFAGLVVEFSIFGTVTLVVAVPLAAIFQAWAMNRHIVIFIPWILVTAIGWWIGVAVSLLLLNFILPEPTFSTQWMNEILPVIFTAAVSGLIVGIPQWLALRNEVHKIGIWWILVSAIGWAVMAPGMITGIPLAYYIEYDYRDLVYRSWQKPATAGEQPNVATKEPTTV